MFYFVSPTSRSAETDTNGLIVESQNKIALNVKWKKRNLSAVLVSDTQVHSTLNFDFSVYVIIRQFSIFARAPVAVENTVLSCRHFEFCGSSFYLLVSIVAQRVRCFHGSSSTALESIFQFSIYLTALCNTGLKTLHLTVLPTYTHADQTKFSRTCPNTV